MDFRFKIWANPEHAYTEYHRSAEGFTLASLSGISLVFVSLIKSCIYNNATVDKGKSLCRKLAFRTEFTENTKADQKDSESSYEYIVQSKFIFLKHFCSRKAFHKTPEGLREQKCAL